MLQEQIDIVTKQIEVLQTQKTLNVKNTELQNMRLDTQIAQLEAQVKA